MKKLLSIAVAALSVSAIAAYTPVSVGVTKITTTNKDTIIPVPFLALSNGGSIPVDQLVNPDGLVDGTALYVYNGSSYSAWVLGSGVWTGAATVSKIGGVDVSAGGDNVTLAAGGAIWIVLPATPSPSQDIYVYGAYSSSVNTSAAAAGVSTLVANPLQSSATISVTGLTKGDVILVPTGDSADPDRYVCTNAETPVWKKNRVAETLTFTVGQGFWYVPANGTSGTRTITWAAAQ